MLLTAKLLNVKNIRDDNNMMIIILILIKII